MFERRGQKVISRARFAKRMALFLAIAVLMIVLALFIGVAGYHWLAGLGFVDSFLNASMILTGMGPVNQLDTAGAKVFASAYALFSGLFFITLIGFVLAPIVHRVLHRFHVDEDD